MAAWEVGAGHGTRSVPATFPTKGLAVRHIPFNRPAVPEAVCHYLRQAVENMHLSGDGPFTKRCHELLEPVRTFGAIGTKAAAGWSPETEPGVGDRSLSRDGS